jgi:Spy/CpxP family protein refolding chaperone
MPVHRTILAAALASGACAAGTPAASASIQLPPMKPGFWQQSMLMHMTMAGQPPDTDNTPNVTFSCMSLQTMKNSMKQMTGALPGCTFDLEGGGGSYTLTTNCTSLGGQPGKMSGTGTLNFTGQTEMRIQETATMASAGLNATMSMSGDAKWVGQCPAGVVPGDFGKMVNGAFQKQGNFTDMPAPPAAAP